MDHKIVFALTQAPHTQHIFLQSKRSQEVLLLKSIVGGHFLTVNTQENALKPQNMHLANIIYAVIYYTRYQLKHLAITKQKGGLPSRTYIFDDIELKFQFQR